jgi:iron-sulfur cluster assembly protein
MAITLTKRAADHVQRFMGADGRGLRLGVKRTGCSGWAYTVDLADETRTDDQVFESAGVQVVVDPKALTLIDGTEVDFVVQGLNRTFVFTNPNVKGECGCGESFSVS